MAVNIPFPLPANGFALNSKVRVNLDFLVAQFNEFNSGTATWDNVSIGTANNLTGTLTFYNASNANYLTIKAGATASNITYTMPATNPANPAYQFLMVNAAGVMRWSTLNFPDTVVGNQLLYVDGAATIKEVSVGSGNKILVNSSPPSFFSLVGTSNQITVTPNVSDFTLSLPQSIATSSNVTFNSVQTDGGSATNPGVRVIFSGASTNTGLWSGSGTELNMTVAGATRFSLDSGGLGVATGELRAPILRTTSTLKLSASTGSIVTIQSLGTSFGDYTLTLPPNDGAANDFLRTDGSGVLTWVSPASVSGTVNSGTQYQFGYYATTAAAISGLSTFVTDTNGNLSLTTASSAATIFTIQNTEASSGSAVVYVYATGNASGDAYIRFAVETSPVYWAIGSDNSTSNAFKISQSSNLGSNDCFKITTAGEVTKPLQPAFQARYTGSTGNATGDGTTVTVPYSTEIFDQNSDYDNTTYTFTAPVTGKYLFTASIILESILVAHTGKRIDIITTARIYTNYEDTALASTDRTMFISAVADMTAGDTAYVTTAVSGSTKTVRVGANAGDAAVFSAALLC